MKWWLAAAALVGSAGSSRAEGEVSPDAGFLAKDVISLEIDHCEPDKSLSKEELLRRGADYYQRGETLYLNGDYKGAVQELVESYCEVPFYSILKDIGQAYERELEYGRAIAYFSRYVTDMPADAKRANSCAPDPQEDKKNILGRIQVLEKLPAKIRIQATPADAKVSIVQDSVVKARGKSGDELVVSGGPYKLVIEHDGFKSIERDIHPDIGKPYTYFETLEPIRGHLRIQTVPGDARIFLDKKLVATGIYDAELPGAKYHLSVEASERETVEKDVELVPDKETNLSIELPREAQFGRRQLLAYSTVAGGAAAALVLSPSSNDTLVGAGTLAGLGVGFVGVYFATDKKLALGTSSLTITSSLIGGAAGGALAATISESSSEDVYSSLIGGGLVIGGVAGFFAGDYMHPSPGDAAVINSGALWGTVAGGLFALSFDPGSQIAGGLVLSGLGMGTVGGVLLQRYFTVSRARAALIDASGAVGIVLGLATENLVQQAQSTSSTNQERTANYMLGGLATGLIVGGVLTRTLDDPKIAVQPSINRAVGANNAPATIVGVTGAF